MNEDVLTLIIGLQNAKAVWLSIEKQMLPATKKQESWLKDFLKKFKGIYDNLATIGKSLYDIDKVFQLARALGTKYADFKTAMLTKPLYLSTKEFM